MHLVRVQDVTLTRQAVPLLIAVTKCLHAGKRDADRIGIVAMRRKGSAAEPGLQSLDAVASRTKRDTGHMPSVAGWSFAQSFKTTFAVGG